MLTLGEEILLGTACVFILGTLVFLVVIEYIRKDNEN